MSLAIRRLQSYLLAALALPGLLLKLASDAELRRRVGRVAPTWAALQGLPYGNHLFSRLIDWFTPYSGTIGAVVTEVSSSRAVVEIRESKALHNPFRSVHACAQGNAMEMASGLLVLHGVEGRGRAILTELNVTYTKKARGRLVAEAKAELPTKSGDVTVPITLRNDAGETVSEGKAVWAVTFFDKKKD